MSEIKLKDSPFLEFLKGMKPSKSENGKSLSVSEIWRLIADKASLDEMGFSSEDELKNWISDNEYKAIE